MVVYGLISSLYVMLGFTIVVVAVYGANIVHVVLYSCIRKHRVCVNFDVVYYIILCHQYMMICVKRKREGNTHKINTNNRTCKHTNNNK